MKKIFLMSCLLSISPLSHAEQAIDSYMARLSAADHENSQGERLRSVGDIIRQDRANFHKYKITDSEDQSDTVFGDVQSRERIPAMLKRGGIDKQTQNIILKGTPVVLVKIYNNRIEVTLQ